MGLLAFGAALLYAGCNGANGPSGHAGRDVGPKALALFPAPAERSGVQLWSENCTRCHYARPPQEYSDAEWDLIVHHMRLRANLTGEEQRKITEFLKASN